MPIQVMTLSAFVRPQAGIDAPTAHTGGVFGVTGRRHVRTMLIWSGFVLGAAGYVALLAMIISVGLTGALSA